MKKYTTEATMVNLNNGIEIIRTIRQDTKNLGQIHTELSREYWRLKELKAQTRVQFYILKRCQLTKRTVICYLCLNEKPFYHLIPRNRPSEPKK